MPDGRSSAATEVEEAAVRLARMTVPLAALLAITGLVLAGCALRYTARTTEPGALVGTWVLDSTFGSTAEQPFVAFAQDGTWTASDGCNRVRGTWELRRSGKLVTTTGPHTLMYCEGAQLPLAVSHADGVRVDGDTLTIMSTDDSTTTRLVRSTDPLVGPQGFPVGYWVEADTPTAPFLSMAADRTFTGNDGCNTLRGTWSTTDDDATRFSDVASTRMACEGVDTWLSGLALGRVVAGVMTIQSADGTVLGQLTRR
jgi:heat shock protein HslJ